MILVTGATGRVGYHRWTAAEAGAEASAMVRVEARGSRLPGTTGHLVASLEDPPPALVLASPTGLPAQPGGQSRPRWRRCPSTRWSRRAPPHVVKVVADGFADPGVEVRFVLSHGDVALHLDATGPPPLIARRACTWSPCWRRGARSGRRA